MPIEYTIDDEQRLVRWRAWGELSFLESRHAQEALRADPRFVPSYRELVDLREVDNLPLNAGEVRALAADDTYAAGTKRAILHPPNRMVFRGLVHMFEAFREQAGGREFIRAFDDLAAAMAWLDEP